MGITPDTIAALQRAGQALNAARSALQQASQQQSARVAQALGENPFGLENDAHFEHWKAIARMAQALQGMEEQLETIFHTAGEIAFQRPLPGAGAHAGQPLRLAAGAALAALEPIADVEPVGTRRGRRPKTAQLAPAPAPAAGAARKPRQGTAQGRTGAPARAAAPSSAPALKGNAARVLAYLSGTLSRRGFTRVTHGEIVAGAGIPFGSVGAALAGLKNRGLLREGERGSYQLA
ncbi:MAG TPA: hypothetical protein VMS38_04650 [Pseudorhodoferax sp.]|nr:hypothetical protein [Pseudorhodoferax sp.]